MLIRNGEEQTFLTDLAVRTWLSLYSFVFLASETETRKDQLSKQYWYFTTLQQICLLCSIVQCRSIDIHVCLFTDWSGSTIIDLSIDKLTFIVGSNWRVIASLGSSCVIINKPHLAVVYAIQYHWHTHVYEGLPIIIYRLTWPDTSATQLKVTLTY